MAINIEDYAVDNSIATPTRYGIRDFTEVFEHIPYPIDALKEFGLLKGSFLSIKRILSCHPIKFLGGGEGFDPVKKNTKLK